MQIDYGTIWKLADLRKKQISDSSLELEQFNQEHLLLVELQAILGKLSILPRQSFKDEPCVGPVQTKSKENDND